ncbi:zinc-binding dehydrogenase [Pseudoduganella namucuonensis]|uniref:5-exo-hydroxycamphor dehydrogenase n=1 Tax=Pseudoduganella namucuonensis TaxID=1035707 RepID=A0A1I7KYY4_9BURK|nr:zinc-binding dehydrogenase [Pseudoduganella namucuonensis]SFV02615.1 5-exo-hydroxycamphor dehydrogenase [Pseudoduganella namucuonensis]
MKYGKAAVMVEENRVETWEVPVVAPEPGGALVRVVLGGVCGSDVHIVSGEAGKMPFPIILGHEGIGRIEQLGAGVDTDYAGTPVKPGDLVYWAPIALCHRCHSCTVLDQTPCDNSTFFEHAEKPNWGSYADYAWLPNGMAFYRLPDHANPDAIAALGCALPTVLRGFEQGGPVGQGDTVIVQGAGPVGLAAVLVAAVSGARKIVVLDHSQHRLDVAMSLGATAAISLKETSGDERRRQIADVLGPRGASVVVEAAGALPAFPEGVDLTGNHGRYIVLGLWGAIGTQPIAPRDLTIKNMRITGATFAKPKHYYQSLHLAVHLQDRYPLASLISHRLAIGDAVKALELVKSGAAIKPVIDPTL